MQKVPHTRSHLFFFFFLVDALCVFQVLATFREETPFNPPGANPQETTCYIMCTCAPRGRVQVRMQIIAGTSHS